MLESSLWVTQLALLLKDMALQVGPLKRFSRGSSKGSRLSHSTGSNVSSSGADSQGSSRSGPAGSIAFTSSSGGIGRNRNPMMETNMAFSDSDGGNTKRSHGTGFFAFSQVCALGFETECLAGFDLPATSLFVSGRFAVWRVL